MEAKEKVLDRIEQTFILLKNNLKNLILPGILFTVGFYYVCYYTFTISSNLLFVNPTDISGLFNIKNIVLLILFIFLVLTYLTVYIGYFIGLVKTIKEAYEEKTDINIKENYIYGFRNILNSFKTYYYIFLYVYLIPSILFIIGGVLILIGQYNGNSKIFITLGIIFLVISFITLIIFAFYKGTKSYLSIFSAIDKDTYTKENFNNSVGLTKDKVLRILGNTMLIGLIIGFIIGMLTNLTGSIGAFSSTSRLLADLKVENIKNTEDILKLIDSISKFDIFVLISGILNHIITTFQITITTIFGYILYKRLEDESK